LRSISHFGLRLQPSSQGNAVADHLPLDGDDAHRTDFSGLLLATALARRQQHGGCERA
jgi:hypothetical protein